MSAIHPNQIFAFVVVLSSGERRGWMSKSSYVLAAILWAAGGILGLVLGLGWAALVPFVCSVACAWAAYRLGRETA